MHAGKEFCAQSSLVKDQSCKAAWLKFTAVNEDRPTLKTPIPCYTVIRESKKTDKQAVRQTDKQTDRQTDRQTETDRLTDSHGEADRQTEKQAGHISQPGRQLVSWHNSLGQYEPF